MQENISSHLIDLLTNPHSPQRRLAAKRLRKLKDASAGQALLSALRKEIHDARTWETQYQMIMALAECGYKEALPHLRQLASSKFDHTMVYVALGDAIVRLGRNYEEDPTPVRDIMTTNNEWLIEGACRAIAILRLKLNTQTIDKIINYVKGKELDNPLRFWVAVSAAGWRGQRIKTFLHSCMKGTREDIKEAADAALKQKYLDLNPL